MNQAIATTEQDEQVLEEKRQSWGNMGVLVHNLEMSLQAEAQQVILSIKTPTTIEEVPDAEAKLKEITTAINSIEEKRKVYTQKFDAVTARLMAPAKSLAEPKTNLSNAIIKIKKEHEAEVKQKQQKAIELQNARDFYTSAKIRIDAELNTKVNNWIDKSYTKALEENVSFIGLVDYIKSVKDAVEAKHFGYVVPSFVPQFNTQDDIDAIISECLIINQQSYVDRFRNELDAKFSDYEIAINNKAQALANAAKEKQEADQKIQDEANMQQMAAKLESVSTEIPVEVSVVTKALKQSFEVDMDDCIESALKIMAAFGANINLCLPKLKVTKWDSFNVGQMKNALSKVKCDDNSFAPAGINFKQVDKL